MPAPAVRSSRLTVQASNSTSWTLVFPSTGADIKDGGSDYVVAGDLIVVTIGRDGGTGTGAISGFTNHVNTSNGTACQGVMLSKIADGTETNLTYTPGASEQGAARIVVYKDWYGTMAGFAFSSVATGTSLNPDPPSLTHGWGATPDTYYRAVCAFDGGAITVDVFPSGYTDNPNGDASGGGAGAGMGSAGKTANSASDNAGTFDISGSEQWVAWTYALRGSNATTLAASSAAVTVSAQAPTLAAGAVSLVPTSAVVTVAAQTPTLAPGSLGLAAPSAVVTVVANAATLPPPVEPAADIPVFSNQRQQATRWALYLAPLQEWRTQPLAPATGFLPEPIAATTLSPTTATVSVVAQTPTLAPGVATLAAGSAIVGVSGQDPSTAASTALTPTSSVVTVTANDGALSATAVLASALATVTVTANDPALAPGSVALVVATEGTVTVTANDPTLTTGGLVLEPATSVVTVVANDATLVPGAAPAPATSGTVVVVAQAAGINAGPPPDVLPYLRLRKPALAPRWRYFQPVVQVAGVPVAHVPAGDVSLAPPTAVVTVQAQTPALGGQPPVPDPAIRLRARSPVRHWASFNPPFPAIATASPLPVMQGVALEAEAAIVTVLANSATLSDGTLAPPSAVVNVSAASADLSAPGGLVYVALHTDQAVRWAAFQTDPAQHPPRRIFLPPPATAYLAVPDGALVTVEAQAAGASAGGAGLTPTSATVTVDAGTATLAASTPLLPNVAVVLAIANDPGLSVSAVSLTPEVAIVNVVAVLAVLDGGAPVIPTAGSRRWWRRYYDFSGGGDK